MGSTGLPTGHWTSAMSKHMWPGLDLAVFTHVGVLETKVVVNDY